MTHLYDVAVVGAGAMGSSAAWALAKAGRDIVALEQFELGHANGGSHGATRIFRVGTEQVHYLDMAQRSRALWSELEAETGSELITVTGAVEHGITDKTADGFARLLRERAIEHAVLDPAVAHERWPGMRFDGPVLYQSGGGIIHADRVVSGLQRIAVEQGATIHPSTRVDRIDPSRAGAEVILETAAGAVRARRVIVTAGAWAAKVIGGVLPLPTITVTQEQPRLFEPYDPSLEWPCFVHARDDSGEFGRYERYGLREAGVGVKVGLHGSGPEVDPDDRDFEPEPQRDEILHAYVREWFPGLSPHRSTPISCLYENTDNGLFVIDRLGPITLATGFNGEGFKFVPLIGELLRDLVLEVADPPPLFTIASHQAAGRRRPT